MKHSRLLFVGMAAVFGLAIGHPAAAGSLTENSAKETKPPFSGAANVNYANALWDALEAKNVIGKNAVVTYPYEGTPPHGKILEYLETTATVDGHAGLAIVKKNYAGEGDPEELEHEILENRLRYLDSVTVMFRREAGYDPDNDDWFWVKYKPDGSLATNPKGMKLAGRVAKGADKGCIACHTVAEGGDYIYSHDRFAE
jgi:hypothetical protein